MSICCQRRVWNNWWLMEVHPWRETWPLSEISIRSLTDSSISWRSNAFISIGWRLIVLSLVSRNLASFILIDWRSDVAISSTKIRKNPHGLSQSRIESREFHLFHFSQRKSRWCNNEAPFPTTSYGRGILMGHYTDPPWEIMMVCKRSGIVCG